MQPNPFKISLQNLSAISFEEQALNLFRHQVQHNIVYREYTQYLNVKVKQVTQLHQIPFLPIEFFKTHALKTGNFREQVIFQSSGTTQSSRSQHFIPDLSFYEQHTQRLFEYFYGPVTDYVFLALLPSYLEQGHSSLVAMVNYFIRQSGQTMPGFYLQDYKALVEDINQGRKQNKKIILIGVTYALLDLAELFPESNWSDIIIMETGGMKGRRKEMIRAELHQVLINAFKVTSMHSEYGMTELLSQAYSKGDGIFTPAPTLKILIRDINDPLTIDPNLKTGGINIIDLANVDSCAFLETKDIGKQYPDGTFEVLGRFDNSDLRGCNLMVS